MEVANEIKEFIESEDWIFAKTYANRAPHEYIVQYKIKGSNDDFVKMMDYIEEHGIEMYFWNYPNKYIFVDGRQYWVTKANDEGTIKIINRCNLSEYKLSIFWKGNEK